jgi:phosphodiesterase/alkaline phosphatase D-like protein
MTIPFLRRAAAGVRPVAAAGHRAAPACARSGANAHAAPARAGRSGHPRRGSPLAGLAAAGVVAISLVGACLHAVQVADPRLPVRWLWSGGVTATTAVVKARVTHATPDLRLLLSTSAESFADARRLPAAGSAQPDEHGVLTFELDGLTPSTTYYYAVSNPFGRTAAGRFRTFAAGPMSFALAFASCAGGSVFSQFSNHEIFTVIERRDPLLFIHLGDLHYSNISRNDFQAFSRAYDIVLGQSRQASLYRHVPIAYMWDDHDFGPNDADRLAPSRAAARQAYDTFVPHYPLLRPGGAVGTIQQRFDIGRVRFLMTDNRSERDPTGLPDSPSKSMLGLDQRAWFAGELERAAADGVPLVVWVNSVPWITRPSDGSDGWQPYSTERTWIADRIEALGLTRRFLVLSGDAHMLAIDDGSNNRFTSGGNGTAGFPVVQAGPLDRPVSEKGGPYSHGVSLENHQFGWLEVTDDGTVLRVRVTGHDRRGALVPGMALTMVCRMGACSVEREPDAPGPGRPLRRG